MSTVVEQTLRHLITSRNIEYTHHQHHIARPRSPEGRKKRRFYGVQKCHTTNGKHDTSDLGIFSWRARRNHSLCLPRMFSLLPLVPPYSQPPSQNIAPISSQYRSAVVKDNLRKACTLSLLSVKGQTNINNMRKKLQLNDRMHQAVVGKKKKKRGFGPHWLPICCFLPFPGNQSPPLHPT